MIVFETSFGSIYKSCYIYSKSPSLLTYEEASRRNKHIESRHSVVAVISAAKPASRFMVTPGKHSTVTPAADHRSHWQAINGYTRMQSAAPLASNQLYDDSILSKPIGAL